MEEVKKIFIAFFILFHRNGVVIALYFVLVCKNFDENEANVFVDFSFHELV